MKRPSNINDYTKLSIQELLEIVATDFHKGMRETFATVNLQLEIAHKLEPREEELEFAWASLKEMERDFIQHISKEEQLLFPILTHPKKRQALPEEAKELNYFISNLKAEHALLKTQIAQIKRITNNYAAEPSFTPSHKLAYAQLNDLEQDFNRLFFVEEEYLFPRAIRFNNK